MSKLKNKQTKSNFVRILERKIQGKFEKNRERFVGVVAFPNSIHIGSYVNENENESHKN